MIESVDQYERAIKLGKYYLNSQIRLFFSG